MKFRGYTDFNTNNQQADKVHPVQQGSTSIKIKEDRDILCSSWIDVQLRMTRTSFSAFFPKPNPLRGRLSYWIGRVLLRPNALAMGFHWAFAPASKRLNVFSPESMCRDFVVFENFSNKNFRTEILTSREEQKHVSFGSNSASHCNSRDESPHARNSMRTIDHAASGEGYLQVFSIREQLHHP